MNKHPQYYLQSLPEKLRKIGSLEKGEIEIVTDPSIIRTIEEEYLEKLGRLENDTHTSSSLGVVFQDEYIVVLRDPVMFKDGNFGTYLRVVERSSLTGKSGVVMLPIQDGKICLNRIFRHATRSWELECPRGFREESQSLEDAVTTEILQELGADIISMKSLGEICSNTGLLAGVAQAYLVRLDVEENIPQPESGESIESTYRLTVEQVNERIKSGEIRDGFTLSVMQLAYVNGFLNL